MKVGHKSSKYQSWTGYRIRLLEEPQSELITSVEVHPAHEYDAEAAVGLVGSVCSTGLRLSRRARRSQEAEGRDGGRTQTDSKHFRMDQLEIDLEANEGGGSVKSACRCHHNRRPDDP